MKRVVLRTWPAKSLRGMLPMRKRRKDAWRTGASIKTTDRIRAAAWRYVGCPATRLALGALLRLLLCSAKQAKQTAAALPPVYALTCYQRQVKCGRCHQMRWLIKKSAAQNCGSHERGGGEEDGKGCRVRSTQRGRRRGHEFHVSARRRR